MNKKFLAVFILSFVFLSLVGVLFWPQKTEAFSGTETLTPNDQGDVCGIDSQTGCPGCPNHYQCVLTSDGDTTHIHTDDNDYQLDLYRLTNSTINSGTINSVTVYAVARGATSINEESLKLAIKTGGTVSEGSGQTLTINYVTYSNTWDENPDTGVAWTWDDINNLQAGVSIKRCYFLGWWWMPTIYPTHVTQVYVKVDFTLNMCKKPDEWNDQGECSVEIVYQDFMPGSGLETCYYRIRNRINGGYDDSPALQPVPCGGASTTYYALMEIDPAGTCSALGEAACMVEATAVDIAGNAAIATSTYNVTAHDLEVRSDPVQGILIGSAPAAYGDFTNYQISDILPGTDIELTALETHIDAGILYYFDNWDGCDSVSGPDNRICQLNMSSNKIVTAEYIIGPYPPTNLMINWLHCNLQRISLTTGQPEMNSYPAFFQWEYTHPNGIDQKAFRIRVRDDTNFDFGLNCGPDEFCLEDNNEAEDGDTVIHAIASGEAADWGTWPYSWATTYYWIIQVQDGEDIWSDWSRTSSPFDNFTTPDHSYPMVDFNWQPDNVMVGEIIQFTDESEAFGGATTTAWSWQFPNGIPLSSNNKNPTTTFSVATTTRVDLRVWDSTGYNCAMYDHINVALPLPDYREVAPR